MNIIHRNRSPFRGLTNIQKELDTVFDNFLSPTWSGASWEGFSPSCDLKETDASFEFSFDLPGLKKEDINVEVKDNLLVVSGSRRHQESREEQKAQHKVHMTERYVGNFSRSFSLPHNVDNGKIAARYENGVLDVVVPKTENSKPKKINIG